MNPYKDLGVDKDTPTEDIKKAYRNKSKETHPDKGGSNEEFDKVRKAWLILSDPAKRKEFDETGTVNERNEQDLIYQDIAHLFFTVIEKKKNRIKQTNIIDDIMFIVDKTIEDAEYKLSLNAANLKYHEGLRNRITTKSKGNIFESMIESRIQQVMNEKSALDNSINKYNSIKGILEMYSCEVELNDDKERDVFNSFNIPSDWR